jgi:hypothetical protein
MNILKRDIKESPFSDGNQSAADLRIQLMIPKFGFEKVFVGLVNLTIEAYGDAKSHILLHILNVMKNLSYEYTESSKLFMTPAIMCLGHSQVSIKEAAIAYFEGLNLSDTQLFEQVINVLQQSDTSHIEWLHEYKLEVIEDLVSDFGG